MMRSRIFPTLLRLISVGVPILGFAIISDRASAGAGFPPPPPSDYVAVPSVGLYDAGGIVSREQGTVSVWLQFLPERPRRDHAIFHTDDSRFVLYVDTVYSPGLQVDMLTIAARAGGNGRAHDGIVDYPSFPEARIFIDNTGLLREVNYGATISWLSLASFPEAEWHHVAMVWEGYPEGSVSIILDGEFMSQKRYGPEFDDGRSMFETFSVGFRPADWIGEIISLPTGEETMLVPRTEMSIEDGGIVIRDLRIYPRALTNEELRRAYVRSITLPTDEPTSPPPEPLPNQRATEIRSSIR